VIIYSYNDHIRLLPPEPWLVGTTKFTQVEGADIVMKSDTAAHIRRHRRDVSSRPPSLVETAAAARRQRSWAERGVSDLPRSGAGRSGRPARAHRRTCRERFHAAPLPRRQRKRGSELQPPLSEGQ